MNSSERFAVGDVVSHIDGIFHCRKVTMVFPHQGRRYYQIEGFERNFEDPTSVAVYYDPLSLRHSKVEVCDE